MTDYRFFNNTFPINFQQLTPEKVQIDVDKTIEKGKKTLEEIKQIPTEKATFENVILPLEYIKNTFSAIKNKLFTLVACSSNSKKYQEEEEKVSPQIEEFMLIIYSDEILFKHIKEIYDKRESLEADQSRLVQIYYEDCIESGSGLCKEDKEKLIKLKKELTVLTSRYAKNNVSALDQYSKEVEDVKLLEGLPESALNLMKKEAEKKGKKGYLITLRAPSYFPVMKNCKNEELRKEIYMAYNKICSSGEYDNTQIIQDILEKRTEYVKLLGFKDFSDFTTYRRMVKSGDNAVKFVTDLHDKVLPFMMEEEKLLKEYKKEKFGSDELHPWDINFLMETIRKDKYSFDGEQFRKYFTEQSVLKGLFEIFNRLYGITFKYHEDIKGWHDDVKYYSIHESNGDLIGGVYMDLYSRDGKRTGAWEELIIIDGVNEKGEQTKPVATVCANLNPPDNGVAKFDHDEVETIFHECGHMIHSVFNKQRYYTIGGTHVAWDFVELPSQIMENWTFEREALDLITKFGDSGNVPEELFNKMWKAKNFMSAYYTMRQLSFCILDLGLHRNYLSSGKKLDEYIKENQQTYNFSFKEDVLSIVRHFSHLFAEFDGYACGYYSYKWAESLDADAFEYFKENGIFNQTIASKFRNEILSKGNSKPADELYRNFRGKEPDFDAILRRADLVKK